MKTNPTYSDERLGGGGGGGGGGGREVGATSGGDVGIFSKPNRASASLSSASSSSSSPPGDERFTFDLFIAVAMLIQMRDDLFRCNGKCV